MYLLSPQPLKVGPMRTGAGAKGDRLPPEPSRNIGGGAGIQGCSCTGPWRWYIVTMYWLKRAQKPCMIWSLGPNTLKYESLEPYGIL